MIKLEYISKIRESTTSLSSMLVKKRLNVKRKKWQAAIYAMATLLLISAGGFLWSHAVSAEEEEENLIYYCLNEAVFQYQVYLKENELFSEKVLEPGRAYITALTDYIDLDFEYYFLGQSEADIKGEYSINATIVATTGQDGHLVWEKDYDLLPTQQFSAAGSDLVINENVVVPVSEYMEFIEQAREKTGYNPAEITLFVKGNVSIEAETIEGRIVEELSPEMIIPMKGNVFTVGGEVKDTVEGGITETKTVATTAVSSARAISAGAMTISAIALILFRLITVPADGVKSEEEVSRIIKKHKERIVVTANGVTSIPRGAITVCSFNELLKLADEVGKPILYPKPSQVSGSDHFFLIYTPEQVYAYGLEDDSVPGE